MGEPGAWAAVQDLHLPLERLHARMVLGLSRMPSPASPAAEQQDMTLERDVPPSSACR